MRTTSGSVVTGHSGQVTASSMDNRGGAKSCTLGRSGLGATGHSHDGPRKMLPLNNGGNAASLHLGPTILAHAEVPGLWVFSGSAAECSSWRLFKVSAQYLSD